MLVRVLHLEFYGLGTQNNVIFQRKLNIQGEPSDVDVHLLVNETIFPFSSSAEPIYDTPSNHFIIFFDTSIELKVNSCRRGVFECRKPKGSQH